MEDTKRTGDSRNNKMFLLGFIICLLLGILVVQQVIKPEEKETTVPTQSAFEQELAAKWGKPLAELPTENLIIVSPHNDGIRKKFKRAFVRHYAIEKGKHVLVWWHRRAGSNAILDFLLSEHAKDQPLPLDVAFGGGEFLFEQLAENEMLVPLSLDETVLHQIPEEFAGVRLRDSQLRWCGNVLSGFGFLYDRQKIESAGLTELNSWQDLTKPELMGQIAIADPQNSGSTVAAFEMVLQSEDNWPAGWKKLLGVLSNTKEFMPGSDDAANAPLFDQASAAICIDFYGVGRQMLEPEKLVYVNPVGETAFTPDPIAILNNAPNPEVAQAFVDFVLSPQGQDLWGKQCDDPQDMMSVEALYRIPIRKDFYASSPETISENVQNPYQQGQAAEIDSELRLLRFRVLRQLVRAAAVANFDEMIAAKQKVIDSGYDASLATTFFKLPENVDTLEDIRMLANLMADSEQSEQIYNQWLEFFQSQYQEILK